MIPMYNLIEYSDIAIIIQKHQEVYGNIIEMNYMMIYQIRNHSDLKLK